MTVFSVTWRVPGWRVRTVIIIVIYLVAFRWAPHAAIPLAVGGTLGGLLAAEPEPRQVLGPRSGRGPVPGGAR